MFLLSHFTRRNSLSNQRRYDSWSSNNTRFIPLTWSAAYAPSPQAAYILVLRLLCHIFYKATVDLPASQELNQQPFLIKRRKTVWKARYREFFIFFLLKPMPLLLNCHFGTWPYFEILWNPGTGVANSETLCIDQLQSKEEGRNGHRNT